MDAVLWGDIFRVANIAAGSAALGLSLWVTVNYARAYGRARQANVDQRHRLLPLHVALIGLSYDLITIALITAFTANQHSPITWRHPIYFVAFAIGAVALYVLTRYPSRREVDLPGEHLSTDD